MTMVPGTWELLFLLPIILIRFGLPLLVLYVLWRCWQRLRRLEITVQELKQLLTAQQSSK